MPLKVEIFDKKGQILAEREYKSIEKNKNIDLDDLEDFLTVANSHDGELARFSGAVKMSPAIWERMVSVRAHPRITKSGKVVNVDKHIRMVK